MRGHCSVIPEGLHIYRKLKIIYQFDSSGVACKIPDKQQMQTNKKEKCTAEY